jgi:predicted transcriptional regulator YheO
MVKATIKSKTGASIIIEGTKEEVAKILSDFERTATIGYVKEEISRRKIKKREEKKRMTASDLIVELKEEGYFDKPKSLTDIAQALESRGFIYPTTTLSGVVLGLVKRKLLGRKKVDGKWVYGK